MMSKNEFAGDNANFASRTLFHGDNLDFLRGLNDESVDLIATDPPFNKGRDFHATPDSLAAGASFQDRWSWVDDVEQAWVDEIKDDNPALMEAIESARRAHSDGMGAFCCFMAVRLLTMHRVLKPTGSIFLHCDSTASHYLKAVMDAVFGAGNFRNEIVWKRNHAKGDAVKGFASNHDVILFYAKSPASIFSPQYREHDAVYLRPYNKVEKETGRRYRLASITDPRESPRSDRHYELMGVTKTWRWTKERMERAVKEGLVVQTKPGTIPQQKLYLDEQKGPAIDSIWTDIKRLEGGSNERVGYPTQKPLALYRRIIEAASKPGDIVLDPFAGCATTCIAAEQLGRKWIGMDLWEKAVDVICDRLKKECEENLMGGKVKYTSAIPVRTDDKKEAAPRLKSKQKFAEPGKRHSRAEMKQILLEQHGCKCEGCDREFDHPDFLQLDHNVPKSQRGINHITNRLLLCGPCNLRKSNTLTLEGLRRKNKKEGFMASQRQS